MLKMWQLYNSKEAEREREREREGGSPPPESKIHQLQSEIQQLEQISNKTAWQEQELKDKKAELAKLEQEKQQSQSPNKTNWNSWLIGGGVVLILAVGIIAYFLGKNEGDKQE